MAHRVTTWFLIADSARAILYERRSAQEEFVMLQGMVNPGAVLKERELKQDRPGRSNFADQPRRNTYQPAHSPAETLADNFARALGSELEKGAYDRKFDQLVIISEQRFLGRLRNFMGAHSKKLLKEEIKKDWHSLREPEILKELSKAFSAPQAGASAARKSQRTKQSQSPPDRRL